MTIVESLHSRLARKPIVVAPGVYDAFTALVAAQAGFATLYVSGAAIAYTRLGRPDIGLVSMSEVAQTVAMIRDRVASHLIVDADTGYGNALNVARTVREFERVGANAIQIEDQDFLFMGVAHGFGDTLVKFRISQLLWHRFSPPSPQPSPPRGGRGSIPKVPVLPGFLLYSLSPLGRGLG